MNKLTAILLALALSACNNVYLKPGESLDKNQVFFADRGGYSFKRGIKELMDRRGYKVIVGKAKFNVTPVADLGNLTSLDMDASDVMNARYVVKVAEREDVFAPYWCLFNGFWWWDFNVSIADQKTGSEIMNWRGHGCANSTLRKFDSILDELEKKK